MWGRLLLTLSILWFSAAVKTAWADQFSLEGGLTTGGTLPSGSEANAAYWNVGFSGQFSYEISHWGFGVRAMGSLSNKTPLEIGAQEYQLSGDLQRREYQMNLIARYFFRDTLKNRGLYLEFGFLAHQTDFINVDNVYTLPDSVDYTRVFIRGSGFTLGVGFRPRNGPLFYQLSYELGYYEFLEITGEVNHLHPVLVIAPLDSASFKNSITFLFGIDVFGR